MKNDYSKIYNKINGMQDSVKNNNLASAEETTVIKQEVIPTNSSPFSNDYKGDWKATQNVNLRSEPAMTGKILTVVQSGDKVECEGYYENEKSGKTDIVWLKVTYKGYTGYTMKAFYSRR